MVCGVMVAVIVAVVVIGDGYCIPTAWDPILLLVWSGNGTFNTKFLYELTLFFCTWF